MTDPMIPADGKTRCSWCLTDPIYIAYHDHEWGEPVHDDRKLFEFLILEGAQAGLSWITILKRREAYRSAYADWDAEQVARFGKRDITRLLSPRPGIIRNRLKIEASIGNARAFLRVQEEFGSFDAYQWRFTDGKTLLPKRPYRDWKEIPAESPESRAFSKDLIARGFRFVGPVICQAHMQAVGMFNHHIAACFKMKGRNT